MPKGTTPSRANRGKDKGYAPASAASQQNQVVTTKTPQPPKTTPNPTPNMFAPNSTPNIFASTPTPSAVSTPNPSNFYQVTAQDSDMASVAAKNNVPLQQVVTANQAKTLPPAGSYIQLGTQGFNYGGGPTATPTTNRTADRRGDPAAQNRRNQASQIATQFANGQMPNSIPSSVLGFIRDKNGQAITLQDLVAEGYVMNANGVLVLSGSPGAPGSGGLAGPSAEYAATAGYQANKDKPFMMQLRWDPKKKKMVRIGDLVRQGRLDLRTGRMSDQPMRRNKKGKLVSANRQGQEPVAIAAPVEPEMTTATPQTILDIHLGSG